MKNIHKNIAIIGTSFTSYACCKKLIENNIKPTIFDYTNNLSNKLTIKNIFSQKKNFYFKNNFFGIGGLSNIWGGIVDYYTDKELYKTLNFNNKKKIFYSNQTFKKLNIKIVKKNQTKILFKKDRLFSSKKYK